MFETHRQVEILSRCRSHVSADLRRLLEDRLLRDGAVSGGVGPVREQWLKAVGKTRQLQEDEEEERGRHRGNPFPLNHIS